MWFVLAASIFVLQPAQPKTEISRSRTVRAHSWKIDGGTIRKMARGGWRAVDDKGREWLWNAAVRGDADVVGALLDAGADATQTRGNGITVLMMAATSGDPECVRRLIAAGADPTSRDAFGLNAADYVRRDMNATPPAGSPTVPATGRPRQYDLILKLLTNE